VRSLPSFILWSGGKESYLSLLKARKRGFEVIYGLSYVDDRSRRLIGCYLREDVVRKQLSTLEIDFFPIYGSKRKGNFRRGLIEMLKDLEVEAGIFGDVSLWEHRNFLEDVCAQLGIRAVFPLWGMAEEVILAEVLKVSKPLIVCRRVRKTPNHILGKYLSWEIVEGLRKRGLSINGENGEYQTLVTEGRDFSLEVKRGRRFRRSYYECIDLEVAE